MGKGLVDKPHLQRFKTRLDELLETYVKKTDKATTDDFGIVKPDGTTITVLNGVISGTSTYVLPTASTSVLGGVKIDGTTITIDSNGVISGASTYILPTASTSTLGGVKIDGSTITINQSGVISATATTVDYSTTEQLTGAKWVDNKSIYQTTITLVSPVSCTAGQWNQICNAPSGIGTLIRGEYTSESVCGCSLIKVDNGKIYVYPIVACSVKHITIEYTKDSSEYISNLTWSDAGLLTWSEAGQMKWGGN